MKCEKCEKPKKGEKNETYFKMILQFRLKYNWNKITGILFLKWEAPCSKKVHIKIQNEMLKIIKYNE